MGDRRSSSAAPGRLEPQLGERERAVAVLRLQGASVNEVAEELGIKPSSVRSTMHRVYRKYGVDNLSDLRSVSTLSLRDEPLASAAAACPCGGAVAGPSNALDCRVAKNDTFRLVLSLGWLVAAPSCMLLVAFFPSWILRWSLADIGTLTALCLGALLGRIAVQPIEMLIDRLSMAARAVLCTVLAAACCKVLIYPVAVSLFLRSTYDAPVGFAVRVYILSALVAFLLVFVLHSGYARIDFERPSPRLYVSALFVLDAVCARAASFDASLAVLLLSSSIVLSFCLLIVGPAFQAARMCAVAQQKDAARHEPNGSRASVKISALILFAAGSSAGMGASFLVIRPIDWSPLLVLSLVPLSLVASSVYLLARFADIHRLVWLRYGAAYATIAVVVGLATASLTAALWVFAGLLGWQTVSWLDVRVVFNVRRGNTGAFAILAVCVGAALGGCGVLLLGADGARITSSFADKLVALLVYAIFFAQALAGVCGVCTIVRMALDALAGRALLETPFEHDAEERARAYLILKGFSPFEIEVALRTARGESIDSIATELHYSKSSVKSARSKAYRLFSVHSQSSFALAFSQVIDV